MADMKAAIEGGLWAWNNGEETQLVVAKDQEEAYRKVIALRMEVAESVEEAESWFEENDTLEQITGLLEIAPYKGELEDSEEEDEDY